MRGSVFCSWSRADGISSRMSWYSVPPSSTAMSCMPPQTPRTGLRDSSAYRRTRRSYCVLCGFISPRSRWAAAPYASGGMSKAPPVTTSASQRATASRAAASSSLYGSTTGSPPAASTASAYASFNSYRGIDGRPGRSAVLPWSGVRPTTGLARMSVSYEGSGHLAGPRGGGGRRAQLRDRGGTPRAGAGHVRHRRDGDAADGDDRQRARPLDCLTQAGDPVRRRKRGVALRAGGEDGTESDVNGAARLGGVDLRVRVGGDSDDRVGAQDVAGSRGRKIVLPEMHAVRGRAAGDVGPVVDEEERPADAAEGDRLHRYPEQISRGGVLQPQLHDSRASFQEGRDEHEGRRRGAAVHDRVHPLQAGKSFRAH